MAKSKKLLILLLCISIAIIPLITQNHIYQGIADGGDTNAVFIPAINQATDGGNLFDMITSGLYPAIGITMWGLGILNKWLQMDTGMLFFFYSLVVLFGAGITLYYLGKEIGGVKTGWVVVALGIFCATPILSLYSYACLANILNVYIILLWSIILAVKWYMSEEIKYIVPSILLLSLYSLLHPTALYLPYAMMVLCFFIIVLAIKRKIRFPRNTVIYVSVVLVAVALNVIVSHLYLGRQLTALTSSIPSSISSSGTIATGSLLSGVWGISGTFVQYLTPVTIIIGLLVIWNTIEHKGWQCLGKKQWCYLVILSSFAIALIGGSYLQATYLPERMIIDASAFIVFIMAIFLGEMYNKRESMSLVITSLVLIGFGLVQTLIRWVV